MAGQAAVFHALLRPSMLQILRATGYHATKGAVLDSVTDLAARYLYALCEATAGHASHNHGTPGDYNVVDVGLALGDVGALLPRGRRTVAMRRRSGEHEDDVDEDLRGLDEFLAWFSGPRMRELMDMGRDGESDATDYLAALKKKHSKTGDDNKYHGTLIGRLADATSDIQVEGGPEPSIDEWVMGRSRRYFDAPPLSPTPSSCPSSLSMVSSLVDEEEEVEEEVEEEEEEEEVEEEEKVQEKEEEEEEKTNEKEQGEAKAEAEEEEEKKMNGILIHQQSPLPSPENASVTDAALLPDVIDEDEDDKMDLL